MDVEGIPYKRTFWENVRAYFLEDDPTFGAALAPLCFLSMALFTRHPTQTNFIFDEQEALLANPYVRSVTDPHSKVHWLDAFHRDFWGLLPDRSIGSYRPIPDLVWRALWAMGARDKTPFLDHWVNVLLHGINGALVVTLVWKLTDRRGVSWLAGVVFVATAVCTEAVTGVVGISDVMGGLGALLALHAIFLDLAIMPLALFVATMFALLCKETALCIVPAVPFAAYCLAGKTHPERPRAILRCVLALVLAVAAFVAYVQFRRWAFPVCGDGIPAPCAAIPTELTEAANAGKPLLQRSFAALLRWYAQPPLPRDPLNNPLIDAAPPYRIAGALRVYFRGLVQIVWPAVLSGDYSAPSEPIPTRLVSVESVLGAVLLVGPLLVAGYIALFVPRKPSFVLGRSTGRDDRQLVAVALVWIVVFYFPVSNIPIVLPTVRAERFWYFPAVFTAVLVALFFERLLEWGKRRDAAVAARGIVLGYLAFQCLAARLHANDYHDDLVFWRATRRAVPTSAKAQLNYGVMLGTRGDLPGREEATRLALTLAPEWPMAHIYLADVICRQHRALEAWPYYESGFERGPNDKGLIALGLQCLWDERVLTADGGGGDTQVRAQLETLMAAHPGTWLDNLGHDILTNGERLGGVDPKNRPRSYNDGPKGD
jgi:hypothetical protein